MRTILVLLLLILSMTMGSVMAQEQGNSVVVRDSWVRWLPGGRPNSAAFMVIENKSAQDVALISVASSKIQSIEMHTMSNENGMMKMRPVPEISIPAGQVVELKPGGLHLMVFGLPEAFQQGDIIDLKLTFNDGTSLSVDAEAKEPK